MKYVLINTKNTLKGSYLSINNLSVFPRRQADIDPESSVFNVLWQFSALLFKFVQTHPLPLIQGRSYLVCGMSRASRSAVTASVRLKEANCVPLEG